MRKVLFICITIGLLGAFSRYHPGDGRKVFVDVNGIDPSVRPGNNFFRYVNGRWYDTATIAADQTGVGSYSFMNIPQKQLLQHILDSGFKNEKCGRDNRTASWGLLRFRMNTAAINGRGYGPVQPYWRG